MTAAVQIALTATPLAAYFYVIGLFHSGSRPRLVPGPVDVGLMAFGLGGLIAFGPLGKAILGRVVGADVGLVAWLIWVGILGLWTLVLAGSATLRVTVYHLSRAELDQAVLEALGAIGGRFSATLNGFEDPDRKAGITVRSLTYLRAGAVEAYGREPEKLMAELRPRLREALSRFPQRPSMVSHAMFGLACLAMLLPVTGFFLANPRANQALRTLMQSLRFW